MWPIDCTKDTIKNRGSTVNIWRIKLSISSIFRSVKTSCLCKIPSAKKNIFLLQKFSVFSFSSYIFFFSEYFPPFPSPIFLLRSSSRYQNVMKSKVQCPHSISRTCLAQEFGLVLHRTLTKHIAFVQTTITTLPSLLDGLVLFLFIISRNSRKFNLSLPVNAWLFSQILSWLWMHFHVSRFWHIIVIIVKIIQLHVILRYNFSLNIR